MPSVEVVTPEQLLKEIAAQGRMPIVRIGQALVSLGMVTDEQLSVALAQQQLDRSVPLGETLLRMGVVSRAQLQTALVRKMGYPSSICICSRSLPKPCARSAMASRGACR